MYDIKQSSTARPLYFFMASAVDGITGVTGLSPTVKIKKNGVAAGTPTGLVTEVDSTNFPGYYQVAGNATDSATLGPLLLHATGTNAQPADVTYNVVAYDPDAALATPTNITAGTIATVTTLTNLPAATTDWLSAAAVSAGAVSKIQSGLATPINITAGTITTVGTVTTLTNLPAATTDWLSAAAVSAGAVTKITTGLATGTDITGLASTLTTILARIGSFTGSGVNTILGFLKALMKSDASNPSDVGGTYDAATDATQALRDRGDAGSWSGSAVAAYGLYGPDDAVVSTASEPYVVALGAGHLDASVIITPVATSGTCSPTTVTLSNTTRSGSFTVTFTASGSKTVSVSDDGGLSDPTVITVTVAAASTADPVTTYSLIGPSGGIEGVESGPFVAALGQGDLSVNCTVTPHSTNVGDTFSPASVLLTDAVRAAAFVIQSPSGTSARTITVTNNRSLTNPDGVIFTPSTDGTPNTTETPSFAPAHYPYYEFSERVTITITPPETAASVKFTTDGTDPRTSGTAQTYSSPFTLSQSRQVKAVAVFSGPTFGAVVAQSYAKRTL